MYEDFKVIAQVALVVKDAEAKAKALAEVLGVEVPVGQLSGAVEDAKTEFYGKSTDARAKLFFFNLGDFQIEIIEPDGKPSTWQKYLDEQGEGIHHIAFRVNDMEGEISRLGKIGLQLEQRGQYPGGEYAYLNGDKKIGFILELLADR